MHWNGVLSVVCTVLIIKNMYFTSEDAIVPAFIDISIFYSTYNNQNSSVLAKSPWTILPELMI